MNPQDNPDLALGVEFFVKPVENGNKSREAGRPIYDEREMVRITFPADQKRELVAPANEMHYAPHHKEQMTYAQRFAPSYEAFKANREDYIAGTPLALMPGMTGARRAEMEALKIKTVEQLAGLPDVARKRIGMGALELQQQAQAFLDQAKDNAGMDAMKAELDALKAQLAAQTPKDQGEGQFADMTDDDLKNMIRDAGGEVPRGNAARGTLIARLNEIIEEKEAA